MRIERRQLSAAASFLACLGTIGAQPHEANAQPPRRAVEIYRGTSKQVVAPDRPATKTESNRTVAKQPDVVLPPGTSPLVEKVAGQSTDSFQRGLMSLSDHLNQLNVIHRVELQLAVDSGDRESLQNASALQLKRLEDISNRLAAMRQPAAVGWAADTLLARTVLADAKWELARIRGDADGEAAAQQEFSQLAVAHFNQRKLDASMGLASLPTMAMAVSLANRVPGPSPSTGQAAEVEQFNQQVVLTTSRWNSSVAGIGTPDPSAVGGIGRIDQLQQAKAGAAEASGRIAIMNQDAAQFQEAILQADDAAQSMFENRLNFRQKGTASLSDLTQAWLIRTRVHEMASQLEGMPTRQMTDSRHGELQQLENIAGSIVDLRGRNAADTSFVQLLAVADSAGVLAKPVRLPESRPTPGLR